MSFAKDIFEELNEKHKIIKEKVDEQPLTKIYQWIQTNVKYALYEAMVNSIPKDKINPDIQQHIKKFVEELEKATFDQYFIREYKEYAYKSRCYILHAHEICKIYFKELQEKYNKDPFFLKHFCQLLVSLEIHLWIRGYNPKNETYSEKIDMKEEIMMKREERKKEIKELFPKTDMKCRKCGKTDISYQSMQLRSRDEP
jgi:hypothetical protein